MNISGSKILSVLLADAKQPSTYRGLAMLAIAFGAPAGTLDHFVKMGFTIIGLLGLIPDHYFTDLFAGKPIDTKQLVSDVVSNEMEQISKAADAAVPAATPAETPATK